MPRRRRIAPHGTVFHVLNRAAKRATLFGDSHDYAAFENLLGESAELHDVAIFAYCLMPNHWHLVVLPHDDCGLSQFMHWLTTTHARRWQLTHDAEGSGAVYQGRFKAIPIGNDVHFLWVCRYVERNALRAGLSERAEGWRWSSLWHRSRGAGAAWMASWPIPVPHDWIDHVNTPQTQAELEAFRSAMLRGEPFGPPEWCRALGPIGAKRPRGRPRHTPGAGVLEK